MAESDPGLPEIVGGHLHVDLVANADADEVFAHFTGDMRQDLMTIRESHTKHCPRQHLRHRASEFNWFFFSHANGLSVISCHWPERKSILKRKSHLNWGQKRQTRMAILFNINSSDSTHRLHICATFIWYLRRDAV